MKTRALWMIPVFATLVAVACAPTRRRSNDDDDGGYSVGGASGTSNNGIGGAATAAGGFGGTNTTAAGGNAPTSVTNGPSTTGPTTTTTTGSSADICNSGLSTDSNALNGCLTASCCASFDACMANGACQPCLTGSGTGCDSDPLYAAFNACADNFCPTDMCASGIGFTDTATQDPIFACNECGDQFCCASLNTCVQGGSDPEVNTCLACLGNENSSACLAASATVRNAAITFNSCIASNCANECGS